MAGHTLSVKFYRETVDLSVVCLEQEGAPCRLTCSVGCDSWSVPHEHEMKDLGYCNAAEWINNGDVEESCCGLAEFPMHDGMPIAVNWDGDGIGYQWRPLRQLNDWGLTAACGEVSQLIEACIRGYRLRHRDHYAKAILNAYFHEASRTVGPIP
jgi:hypothetical protein